MIILLSIWAILKNLSFRLFSFINTLKCQSIINVDKKDKGQIERQSDIIYVVKYLDVFFELIYIKCSRLYCN